MAIRVHRDPKQIYMFRIQYKYAVLLIDNDKDNKGTSEVDERMITNNHEIKDESILTQANQYLDQLIDAENVFLT